MSHKNNWFKLTLAGHFIWGKLMEIISYILLAILASAMTMLNVFFVLLFRKNMRQGREFRKNLAQSLQQLRMSKVLSALGLDSNAYLHKSSVHNIKQHMSKCENCSTTGACDEKLSQPTIQHVELEFCPIQEDLFEFSTTTRKAA
jgi:hypothetical protein